MRGKAHDMPADRGWDVRRRQAPARRGRGARRGRPGSGARLRLRLGSPARLFLLGDLDENFTWLAAESASPHEWFECQTLLGYLAARFPDARLGVGVSEAIRRHPVVLAQAALTLAHLSRRPPILGVGAGERLGSEPYGLDFSRPVGRLEEALQIIRRCLDTQGPLDFAGEHFRLRGATLESPAPAGRTPEIWVAAHGPRMLRLAGRYGDGWYPSWWPPPTTTPPGWR